MRLYCPDCGGAFDLIQALEDADGRRFVELLTGLPPVVAKPLVRYLRLFKPPQQGLRWSRMLSLTRELAPMIQAAQVTRHRNTYVVAPQQWADAMTMLVESPSPDLRLPLKSNGYLLGMLANVGEQQAGRDEQRAIERHRRRGRDCGTGGAVPVGNLLGKKKTTKTKQPRSVPPPGWKGPLGTKGNDHE